MNSMNASAAFEQERLDLARPEAVECRANRRVCRDLDFRALRLEPYLLYRVINPEEPLP